MTKNILKYSSFINESIDSISATENIIDVVKAGSGWIDPQNAIEMFQALTGVSKSSSEIFKMLSALGGMNFLYYADKMNPGKKGEKVTMEDLEEFPQRAPAERQYLTATSESLRFSLRRLDEF